MPGDYVVFRDLSDSSFVLTADSSEGRAATTGIQLTTEPEPDPNLPPDPNAPIHVYNANSAGNTDTVLMDEAGTATVSLTQGTWSSCFSLEFIARRRNRSLTCQVAAACGSPHEAPMRYSPTTS